MSGVIAAFGGSHRFTPLANTLVILGSSNGAGEGASTYTGDPSAGNGWASPSTSWAGLLVTALGGTWHVYNRCRSGSYTQMSIDRFWTDVAPHRPSHVIICTAVSNEPILYDTTTFYNNTVTLCNMCKAIGAIPIVRGAYVYNGINADRYTASLALNSALSNLGYPYIDHMSLLDAGNGHFICGTTYSADGQHPNDVGYAAFYSVIDLGLFTLTSPAWIAAKSMGAWRCTSSAYLATIANSAQVNTNIKSFTLRSRIKSQAGANSGLAFLAASIYGASAPLRLRNGSSVYDLGDSSGSILSSTINPTSDYTVHDMVITYNHLTNSASLYGDGALIGAVTPVAEATAPMALSFGGRPDTASTNAVNYSFSDVGFWQVPLSAADIAALNAGTYTPRGAMIFDADLSSPPVAGGACPNAIRTGLAPVNGNPLAWAATAPF